MEYFNIFPSPSILRMERVTAS